ncbi:hypothetical protein AURDEDRAFT_188367 [Auricularia subglabra TFB-10046 SS5]|uniref:Uncharacterized protein n=1 Tax=Auricularia subglabra (strain TFB-10046 / SS5) TaxID=717982 RepID=J0WUS9_AURST|nr:hypothetical protein AURDEDRAFT_188367 [Auricularia subglabra TFB-10046 SS5]
MPRIPFPVGSAAVAAGAISGESSARTISSLADLLITAARNVRVNTTAALTSAQHIQDLVAVVQSELEDNPDATWAHAEPLVKVEQTLRDISSALEAQGKRSYLSQLLHSERDREVLKALAEKVTDAFAILMVHMRIESTAFATTLSARMESLVEKHAAHVQKLAAIENGPVARCPPVQEHYFGRSYETDSVVRIVCGDTAGRVAILGGPGMGKTTLAIAVLHNPLSLKRFGSRRFFVPCDSAESSSTTIAATFGIPTSDPKVLRKRLQNLLGTQPSLLVLDNFEAVWETPGQRADAEDMLLFLDSVESLSLLVTLRGAERPEGVRWSRPFAASLAPLSDAAAQQVFLSIADIPEDSVGPLLAPLDGIPLAVVLMASLAQYESPRTLLSRWNELRTSMLVRGHAAGRQSSLDVSIQLSVQSPRMTALPAAHTLLSVLALLPHGIVDTDLPLLNLDLSVRAMSVLSQNALAACGSDRRIRVLAPIRAFMVAYHPPTAAVMAPVYDHYFGLLPLTRSSLRSTGSLSSVAPELGNIDSLALHALRNGHAPLESATKAVTDLCALYADHGIGSAPELVKTAVSLTKEANLDDVRADLLLEWGRMAFNRLVPGDSQKLHREALALYQSLGNKGGIIDSSIFLTDDLNPTETAAEAARLYRLAEELQDFQRMARCAWYHAGALGSSGRLAEAKELCELSISVARRAPASQKQETCIGLAQLTLGWIYRRLGDEKRGDMTFREALGSFEAAENAGGITAVCMHLAARSLSQGRTHEAIAHAERASGVQTHGVAGFRPHANLMFTLASAYAWSGNPDAAGKVLEKLRYSMPDDSQRSAFLLGQAVISLANGDTIEARALLSYARCVARQGDPVDSAQALVSRETTCTEILAGLEPCRDTAATLAIVAAVSRRQQGTPALSTMGLVLLAEAVDDDFAELLVETVLFPLLRWRKYSTVAIAHLRRASTAQRRGQHDLACRLARNALRYFGDFRDLVRIQRAERILEECSAPESIACNTYDRPR